MTRACRAVVMLLAGSSVAGGQARSEVRLDAPAPLLMSVIARNGKIVAGASMDHTLRVWDVRTARVVRVIDIAGRDPAWLAISPDGVRLLMGDYAGLVTVWNTSTGQRDWEFRPPHYVIAAMFSPDGSTLAIAPGTPVQIYDLTTHRLVRELRRTVGTTSLAFSRDGAWLASTDGDRVRMYDVRSGTLRSENADFAGVQLTVDFSTDGSMVFAAGGDRSVVLVDGGTGKTVRRSTRLPDPIFYLETAPSGREIAIVTQNADDPRRPAPIVFADASTLVTRTTWRSPAGVLLPGATWTTDGHFIAVTQSDGTLHVWTVR